MPDQNQSDPNNNQQPIANNPQATVVPTVADSANTPPPFFPSEDTPPVPDFQAVPTQTPAAPIPTTSVPSTQEPVDDNTSGSAAPVDFPPMNTSPKKKFGGGKIIATILGLFVLIGGVGAGIVLTQQQQQFQQKAALAGSCACMNDNGVNTGPGVCKSDGSCDCSPNKVKNNNCSTSSTTTTTGNGDTCAPGSNSVCVGKKAGSIIDPCSDGNGNSDPNDDKSLRCDGTGNNPICSANNVPTAGSCGGSTSGGNTTTGQPGCIFDHYQNKQVCTQVDGKWKRCDTNPVGEDGYLASPTFACDSQHPIRGSAGVGTSSTYCLAVAPPYCTPPGVSLTANCVNDNTCGGSNNPTPTPTAPGISAQCQNVKAYSSTWSALTSAQLSALTPTTVVNFCVVGSATSGTFDKAKFTINSVAQSETTTQRPGSQDFCQSYTIPTGVTTFNVSAQIHHVTLGYK